MSSRIRQCVQTLQGYLPGEQPRGSSDRLIKLNTNENPYPPPPSVTEALSRLNAEDMRLYPDPECGELRSAVARLHGCALEQVFAGNGSDEILALATRAFVEDDGNIGFFEPSYSLYPVLAAIRNVAARPIELGPEFDWRMPGADSSLFFMANPNAPTGTRFPLEPVQEFCRLFKGVVVIDEAYAAFAEGDCLSVALELGNVLAVRTLSKSHSLAGLRIGYAVGAAPLINALFKIKDSYNISRVAQAVGRNALLDVETVMRNARLIKRTRARCAVQLERLGFKVFCSEANFLWVQPPEIEASLLFRKLRERAILVRHFPGKRTGDYLRVTIGTDEQMDAFMAAVEDILVS